MVRSGERFWVTRPICRTTSGSRGLGLRDAVLGLHLRDVEIGAQPEGHRDREVAVRRRRGVGVDRVLDAVDLLLERRDDGLGNGLGRGAGILAADHHGGRHDFRVLADGQRRHRQQARDGDR